MRLLKYLKNKKKLIFIGDFLINEKQNPEKNAENWVKTILKYEKALFLTKEKNKSIDKFFGLAKQYISDDLAQKLDQKLKKDFYISGFPLNNGIDSLYFIPNGEKVIKKMIDYTLEEGKDSASSIPLEEWKEVLGDLYSPRLERHYKYVELQLPNVERKYLNQFSGATILTPYIPWGDTLKMYARTMGVKLGKVTNLKT